MMQPHEHWRAAALREFPEHEEFALSDDEEYGIYNLFFQLRDELTEAIAKSEVERAWRIIDFAARCLCGSLGSDGEDIGAAAGVSLFEHVFEDSPRKRWPVIFFSHAQERLPCVSSPCGAVDGPSGIFQA